MAQTGVHVLATLDESTYSPVGMGEDLRMGDHPIAWTQCIGDGRSLYSAIGHRPESYTEPTALHFSSAASNGRPGLGESHCRSGQEVPRGQRADQ